MKLRELSEKYADALWSISDDPKDWAFMDTVRDYEAGFREAIRLAAEVAQRWEQFPAVEVAGQIRALTDDAQKTPLQLDNSTPTPDPKGSGTP